MKLGKTNDTNNPKKLIIIMLRRQVWQEQKCKMKEERGKKKRKEKKEGKEGRKERKERWNERNVRKAERKKKGKKRKTERRKEKRRERKNQQQRRLTHFDEVVTNDSGVDNNNVSQDCNFLSFFLSQVVKKRNRHPK